MKQRKALSLLMALMLVVALCVPTLAAGDVTTAGTPTAITVTATMNEMTVKIVVNTTVQMTLNPYKLMVEISGDDLSSDDQVIFVPQFIENHSNVPIKVSVNGMASGTGVTIAAAEETAAAAASTTKTAFLKLRMKTVDATMDGVDVLDASPDELDNNDFEFVFGKATLKAASEAVTLKAAVYDATGDNTLAETDGCALYDIVGTLNESNWTTANNIKVTLTFTFDALANTTEE